jgi:hypothetical protein
MEPSTDPGEFTAAVLPERLEFRIRRSSTSAPLGSTCRPM